MARDRQLPLGQATSVVLFAMLVDQVLFALTVPVLWVSAIWLDVFPAALGAVGTGALAAFLGGYLVWVAALAYGTLFRPDRLARVVGGAFGWRPLQRFRERALQTMDDVEERSRALRSKPARFYLAGAAISLVPLAVPLRAGRVRDRKRGARRRRRPGVRAVGRDAARRAGRAHAGRRGRRPRGSTSCSSGPLQPQALVAPTLLVWRLLSFYAFLAAGAVVVARHLRQRPAPAPALARAHD